MGVAALKRQKAFEHAKQLLKELIEAAEQEARAVGASPPWWYYEQLAIVLRRMGDIEGEVEIIRRYLQFPHPRSNPRPELAERLERRSRGCETGMSGALGRGAALR